MLGNFAILDFGAPELVIILAIVLLLFGGKKLPELSKSLGVSMKNLKDGFSDASGATEDFKKQANQIKQELSFKPTAATTTTETQEKTV
jgi:sec-independent protein translocase protein TatA